MGIKEIGCCGAYGGTCRALKDDVCKGCKLGYEDGKRDFSKVKCKIKICCTKQEFNSCADCGDYSLCHIIQGLYKKNGYKYKKYQQATEFIRAHGYDKFIEIANGWKMQYGKYK